MCCHKAKLIIPLIMIVIAILSFTPSCKPSTEDTQRNHFCTLLPGKSLRDTMFFPEFLGSSMFKWKKKTTLKVYFFNGEKDQQQKTIQIANEWANYCNMKFEQSDNVGLSDIRVTFRTNRGDCSYVGNEADSFPRDTTMFLQDIDEDLKNGNTDARRIILHEFGHGLGLNHELQHPDAAIPWDTAAVYTYYKEKFKWEPPLTYQQVFEKINDIGLKSQFDTTSIMVYAVPSELTLDKKYTIRWPENLSETDKKYIKKYYKPIKPQNHE